MWGEMLKKAEKHKIEDTKAEKKCEAPKASRRSKRKLDTTSGRDCSRE